MSLPFKVMLTFCVFRNDINTSAIRVQHRTKRNTYLSFWVSSMRVINISRVTSVNTICWRGHASLSCLSSSMHIFVPFCFLESDKPLNFHRDPYYALLFGLNGGSASWMEFERVRVNHKPSPCPSIWEYPSRLRPVFIDHVVDTEWKPASWIDMRVSGWWSKD